MAEPVDKTFREWTRGEDAVSARVSIYEKIRNIAYAVIPAQLELPAKRRKFLQSSFNHSCSGWFASFGFLTRYRISRDALIIAI